MARKWYNKEMDNNQQTPSGAYAGKSKVVKWVIIYLVIGVVLYGGLYLAKFKSSYTAPVAPAAPEANAPQASAPALPAAVVANASGKISIKGFKFNPASVTVALGETVVWTNDDTAPHTITADAGQFDSGSLAPGQSFAMPPLNPGTYAYHCKIHPSMKGTVTVK